MSELFRIDNLHARPVVDDDTPQDNILRGLNLTVNQGEVHAIMGPNGTGKSHLLRALADTNEPHDGDISFGPRTSIGTFTQINDRPDFIGRQCFDIVRDRVFDDEKSMKSLARYGLAGNAKQEFDTLSGGQKARLEILCLELEGHNVLLLDEPTDNLDIESSEALEKALDYAQTRKAFDKPIADYQGVTFPLAESATELHAAHLMGLNVATLLDRGEAAVKELSMTKAFSVQVGYRAVDVPGRDES